MKLISLSLVPPEGFAPSTRGVKTRYDPVSPRRLGGPGGNCTPVFRIKSPLQPIFCYRPSVFLGFLTKGFCLARSRARTIRIASRLPAVAAFDRIMSIKLAIVKILSYFLSNPKGKILGVDLLKFLFQGLKKNQTLCKIGVL